MITEHIKISSATQRIYICEDLSAKNKRLFFPARDAARMNNFECCWVSHVKIFVRERAGTPCFQLKSEASFASIVKPSDLYAMLKFFIDYRKIAWLPLFIVAVYMLISNLFLIPFVTFSHITYILHTNVQYTHIHTI